MSAPRQVGGRSLAWGGALKNPALSTTLEGSCILKPCLTPSLTSNQQQSPPDLTHPLDLGLSFHISLEAIWICCLRADQCTLSPRAVLSTSLTSLP